MPYCFEPLYSILSTLSTKMPRYLGTSLRVTSSQASFRLEHGLTHKLGKAVLATKQLIFAWLASFTTSSTLRYAPTKKRSNVQKIYSSKTVHQNPVLYVRAVSHALVDRKCSQNIAPNSALMMTAKKRSWLQAKSVGESLRNPDSCCTSIVLLQLVGGRG